MSANPHIGPSGLKPGEFGYEFDCSLADCTYRYHSLSLKDFHPGVLEIVPPAGKVAHLQIGNLIEAAPDLLAALRRAEALIEYLRPIYNSSDVWQMCGDVGEVARAAIAKAEGR